MVRYSYQAADRRLRACLRDLEFLSREGADPADASWQDVARSASANLRALADLLEAAAEGDTSEAVVFPDVEVQS